MIQGPPQPALLDVTSIAQATVLVLDSFFYVVVFHGTTVAQWRKAEYHLNPEHAAFAQLLEVRCVSTWKSVQPCTYVCSGTAAACDHTMLAPTHVEVLSVSRTCWWLLRCRLRRLTRTRL